MQRLNGPEVAGLPPVPVAEDGTFVLEDVLPDRVGDVHYAHGDAGVGETSPVRQWEAVARERGAAASR
ncbi:hypothetical protein [Streptomyces caelestis]|uniref:hypothetical protein n=1 Tax=Streptomyces caelestis TaxID=36816 RepID=UPI003669AF5C